MTWERYRFLYPRYEPNYVWLWPEQQPTVAPATKSVELSYLPGWPQVQVQSPTITKYQLTPLTSSPTQLTLQPKRAICLDLDETLVKTWERRRRPVNILDTNAARAYDLDFGGNTYNPRNTPTQYYDQNYAWGLTRPYLAEFLQYCRRRFDYVFIWTAGHRDYAEMIVKIISQNGFQPDAVYSREHCVMQDQILKPLDRLYQDWQLQPSQLLMVDNNHTVILPQDKDNLIHIPDYEPNPLRPDGDICLWQLVNWLNQTDLHSYDVRQLPKKEIFAN